MPLPVQPIEPCVERAALRDRAAALRRRLAAGALAGALLACLLLAGCTGDGSGANQVSEADQLGNMVGQSAASGSEYYDIEGAKAQAAAQAAAEEEARKAAEEEAALGTAIANDYEHVVRIRSCADGQLLRVDGGNISDGASVYFGGDDRTGSAVWAVRTNNDGTFFLRNVSGYKLVTDLSGSGASGAQLAQYAGDGTEATQRFNIYQHDDGTYSFVLAGTNVALDETGGGGYDGAPAQLYDYNGSDSQRFTLEIVSSTSGDGSVSSRQQAIVDEVSTYNLYGLTSGWCEGWVEDVYERVFGVTPTAMCCARVAWQTWGVSTSMDDIPVGAALFAWSRKGTIDSTCGQNAGHVLFYIGNGMCIGNNTPTMLVTLEDFYGRYGYLGWGWIAGDDLR